MKITATYIGNTTNDYKHGTVYNLIVKDIHVKKKDFTGKIAFSTLAQFLKHFNQITTWK